MDVGRKLEKEGVASKFSKPNHRARNENLLENFLTG
jgi:hypothetical protein